MVFAETVSGTASVGRQSILDTSNNYYYTDWKLLSTNSLNSIPVGSIYSGNAFYLMGSEYSYPISLTGQTNFAVTVRVPVSANTIYTYQETDGLDQSDFRVGISPNFAVYNITPTITSFNRAKGVYARNGVAHVYMYYDVVFNFTLSEPLTGAYNLNFSVMNLSANRSAYYLSGGNSGVALEFPVGYFSGQNEPDAVLFSMMSPSVSLSYGTTTDNQDIIDANNENTQLIISNNNENTQDIIDSINENYENLVNSQEVCSYINNNLSLTKGSYFRANGTIGTTNNPYGITDYIIINNSSLKVLSVDSSDSSTSSCFYTKDKIQISCFKTNVEDFTVPNNAYYFRTTIQYVNNQPTYSICKNGNQAIADSILDDTIDDFIGSQQLDEIGGQLSTDTPITDLLALPITLIRAIITGINGTCSSFDLGALWGVGLTIPCINPELYLGSNLWNLIDLLFCGFMIFNIAQLMIHDFDSLSNAEDLFDETYTPRHEKVRRSQ